MCVERVSGWGEGCVCVWRGGRGGVRGDMRRVNKKNKIYMHADRNDQIHVHKDKKNRKKHSKIHAE